MITIKWVRFVTTCRRAILFALVPVLPVLSSPALASQNASVASSGPSYVVSQLSSTSPGSVLPGALNDSGEAVGTITSPRFSRAFIYKNHILARLAPPHGFVWSRALSVNNAGSVLTETGGTSRSNAFFVVAVKGQRHYWAQLRVATGTIVSANQIASNGDVVGTIRSVPGPALPSRERAVVWSRVTIGAYRVAKLLPLSGGFERSRASVIWSRSGRTLVSGLQRHPQTSSEDVLTVWSRSSASSSFRIFVDGDQHVASAIGGRPGHVYAAGLIPGVDTTNGWAGRVAFEHGTYGAIRASWPLFLPKGYPGFFVQANGVAADEGGDPVVVGRVSSSGTHPATALLWRGKSYVMPLQSLLSGTPEVTLDRAIAINDVGQIICTGRARGHNSAFILTPKNP